MKETQLFKRGKKCYFLKPISLTAIPTLNPVSQCHLQPCMHYACACQEPWQPWQSPARPKALQDSPEKRKPASRGYQSSQIMFPSPRCIIQLNTPDGMKEIDSSPAFSCFPGKLKALLSKHNSGRNPPFFLFLVSLESKFGEVKHFHNYLVLVYKNAVFLKPRLLK